MSFMLQQFGGGAKFRRVRATQARRMVSEVFSPPRITSMMRLVPDLKLVPGFALDLTTCDPDDGMPWNFDVKAKRDKARRLVQEQRPLFLIGSPDCTAFCSWQVLNRILHDAKVLDERWTRAMVHLRFCCQLYRDQLDGGRYFIHEHPRGASSWGEECIQKILRENGVDTAEPHLCQYGLTYRGDPVKKPARFMSNSPQVLRRLQRRCTG